MSVAVGSERGLASSSEEEELEYLCEYEKKRLDNIKLNQEMLKMLGELQASYLEAVW